MTRDEILNMPAGREMDALIAEKVMGHTVDKRERYVKSSILSKRRQPMHKITELFVGGYYLRKYSESIEAAWEVVNKICVSAPNDCWTGPTMQINYEHDSCEVIFTNLDSIDCAVESVQAIAESAPLAICRAALLTTLEDE